MIAATDMTVANTILAQLGGSRFLAMTGAKKLVGSDDSLSMQLPGMARYRDAGGNSHRVNGVLITLTPADTYTVEAVYVRSGGSSSGYYRMVVASRSDVYVDNLRDIFTSLTGLATSL